MQSDLFLALAAGGIAALLLGAFFLGRLTERRRPLQSPTPKAGALHDTRLSDAVDAIALEVERIGENQRYLTRLLTASDVDGKLAQGARPEGDGPD